VRRQRNREAWTKFAGCDQVAHVVDIEELQRQVRRTRVAAPQFDLASSAISTGALSPIGEPFATLPPSVPA
jgi:hypothetical protein